jgi:hypothetical protein
LLEFALQCLLSLVANLLRRNRRRCTYSASYTTQSWWSRGWSPAEPTRTYRTKLPVVQLRTRAHYLLQVPSRPASDRVHVNPWVQRPSIEASQDTAKKQDTLGPNRKAVRVAFIIWDCFSPLSAVALAIHALYWVEGEYWVPRTFPWRSSSNVAIVMRKIYPYPAQYRLNALIFFPPMLSSRYISRLRENEPEGTEISWFKND